MSYCQPNIKCDWCGKIDTCSYISNGDMLCPECLKKRKDMCLDFKVDP